MSALTCTSCGADEMATIWVERGTVEMRRGDQVMPGVLKAPAGQRGYRIDYCTACALVQGVTRQKPAGRPSLRVLQGGA
jgi:hypothetical protein